MADQAELMEQYRVTLEVMREKLHHLREEKEKQQQEILEKKESSQEYQNLVQELESLQEGNQSLNLEIFKEKGNLRKLKADSEWDDEKLQSAELVELRKELKDCLEKNNELKADKTAANNESKLAQLEISNPKLFALVKKIIVVEETNAFVKEELNFLEQERNKTRAEYYKITQVLGQEEKIKLRIREVEKEIERSEYNCVYLNTRLNDSRVDLENEKNAVQKSELKNLVEKYEDLKLRREDAVKLNSELRETIFLLDAEIEVEKKCENKTPPTNLKQEIKNLEADITEKTKELRQKLLEKKKLLALYKQQVDLSKKAKAPTPKELNFKSPTKVVSQKILSSYGSPESGKRDIIVSLVGKSIAEGNPKDMKNVLKHVGSQGQGIATKLVQLNRDEFLKTFKYGK